MLLLLLLLNSSREILPRFEIGTHRVDTSSFYSLSFFYPATSFFSLSLCPSFFSILTFFSFLIFVSSVLLRLLLFLLCLSFHRNLPPTIPLFFNQLYEWYPPGVVSYVVRVFHLVISLIDDTPFLIIIIIFILIITLIIIIQFLRGWLK